MNSGDATLLLSSARSQGGDESDQPDQGQTRPTVVVPTVFVAEGPGGPWTPLWRLASFPGE
jgi:hypothetical protein